MFPKKPLKPNDHSEIIVGIDFGRTPSAVFIQHLYGGRWAVLHELIGQDIGAAVFAEMLKRDISRQIGISIHLSLWVILLGIKWLRQMRLRHS